MKEILRRVKGKTRLMKVHITRKDRCLAIGTGIRRVMTDCYYEHDCRLVSVSDRVYFHNQTLTTQMSVRIVD